MSDTEAFGEYYALDLMRKWRANHDSIIQASGSEIGRLNALIDEQKLVIRQRAVQLEALDKAIDKLERS